MKLFSCYTAPAEHVDSFVCFLLSFFSTLASRFPCWNCQTSLQDHPKVAPKSPSHPQSSPSLSKSLRASATAIQFPFWIQTRLYTCSVTSSQFFVANSHSVLVRSCTLKSRTCHTDALTNAPNKSKGKSELIESYAKAKANANAKKNKVTCSKVRKRKTKK